ncbi:MAG: acyl-CoA thioesterase II [Pseudomonadota bacterium]|nr:acyl-CoA thioesterase II [Pseudomonadota bacterium]
MNLEDLKKLLDLEPLEDLLFRGESWDVGGRMVFGGQVLAQALMAAGRTVPAERHAHSLHAYFLRPGAMDQPIVFRVETPRDGRSFTTRHVAAIQRGRPIFQLSASFQIDETGLDHQSPTPQVPDPATLTRTTPPRRSRPFDFRRISPSEQTSQDARPNEQQLWLKTRGELEENRLLHQCVLAYVSDFHLLSTALLPHGLTFQAPGVRGASLDHAMWFHRPFRADDWLLYSMESPNATGGRGLAHGRFYDTNGQLVASASQEGLLRYQNPAPESDK